MFKKICNFFSEPDSKVRKFKLFPCDKADCMLYSEWEVDKKYSFAERLPSIWQKNQMLREHPGYTECVACVHFKGFDLYRQMTPEMVERIKKSKPK